MTPSPWPQRRKGTLCRVNGGFVPHEWRTKQWGPAFSFKSRDAFVLKDKNYLRAAPGLLRGEGASAPSFPVSGRLDPGTSQSLGHQHPWKDLEAGGLQLGPNVTGPLLPPENSPPNSEFPEKMPERDRPPHTSGNPAADQPSQRRHMLSEEWQALQLPSRKEVTDTWSPTPGHPYPVTDTWSPTPGRRDQQALPLHPRDPHPLPRAAHRRAGPRGWGGPTRECQERQGTIIYALQARIILNSN